MISWLQGLSYSGAPALTVPPVFQLPVLPEPTVLSQLQIKFFSKRQENFRAKAPSRKEKQVFWGGVNSKLQSCDSLCALCGSIWPSSWPLREIAFLVYLG
jgi:hypothetical protein